ncbi:hypothetical protein ACFXTH_037422 [Malus domestica]
MIDLDDEPIVVEILNSTDVTNEKFHTVIKTSNPSNLRHLRKKDTFILGSLAFKVTITLRECCVVFLENFCQGKHIEMEDEVAYDDVDGVQVDTSNSEIGDLGDISASGSGGGDDEIRSDDGGDEQISVSGNGGEDNEISCHDGSDEQSVGEEDVLEPPHSSTRFFIHLPTSLQVQNSNTFKSFKLEIQNFEIKPCDPPLQPPPKPARSSPAPPNWSLDPKTAASNSLSAHHLKPQDWSLSLVSLQWLPRLLLRST